MSVITITHQGRVAALAGDTRVWLAAHVQALPDAHPRKRWICFMALYARDVLTGVLPGPYTDHDAERYARACLIPRELLERPGARHPARRERARAPRRRPTRRLRRAPPPRPAVTRRVRRSPRGRARHTRAKRARCQHVTGR